MKKLHFLLFVSAVVLTAIAETEGATPWTEQLSTHEKCLTAFQNPQTDSILRRKAFRILLESPHADTILQSGIHDADTAIRCRSIYEWFRKKGDDAFAQLKEAVRESDPQAATLLLNCAQRFKDNDKSRELITLLSKQSPVLEVRRAAIRIIDFPYYRKVTLLRDNPTHDHEVVTIKSIPLEQTGWRFRPDPMEDGHHKGWFNQDFDDAKWTELHIGAWEKQGFDDYDGIAWYRFRFTMPEKIDCNAVEIHFGAVDESAWVWLNGKYVGQHDIGPAGWDRPFDLDITQEINWNGENQLSVRVEDTMAAGGIWKEVIINIVK